MVDLNRLIVGGIWKMLELQSIHTVARFKEIKKAIVVRA